MPPVVLEVACTPFLGSGADSQLSAPPPRRADERPAYAPARSRTPDSDRRALLDPPSVSMLRPRNAVSRVRRREIASPPIVEVSEPAQRTPTTGPARRHTTSCDSSQRGGRSGEPRGPELEPGAGVPPGAGDPESRAPAMLLGPSRGRDESEGVPTAGLNETNELRKQPGVPEMALAGIFDQHVPH